MIKTQFPYSHDGKDFLVSAQCLSVDSLETNGLKFNFIDEESFDEIDVQFSDREQEEFVEYCVEKLEEKQAELELNYVF